MPPTVLIQIPNVLRHHTGGRRRVTVSATTVGVALEALFEQHPSLRNSLIPKSGDIFEAVNVFLNDTDIGPGDRLETQVNDGDSITILPAMAGGRERTTSGCNSFGVVLGSFASTANGSFGSCVRIRRLLEQLPL